MLVSTKNTVRIKIGNFGITNSKREEVLEVEFDHKFPFHYHISELCKKGSSKTYALSRVTSYTNISKWRILMIAFCQSQFRYYPFLWMCNNCANNSKINRLHKYCLQKIYSNKESLSETLLEKDGTVSIHIRNLLILATDVH